MCQKYIKHHYHMYHKWLQRDLEPRKVTIQVSIYLLYKCKRAIYTYFMKAFEKNYYGQFLDSKSRSMHLWNMLWLCFMFLRTRGIYWWQLEYRMTHRKYFIAGERHLFRFVRNFMNNIGAKGRYLHIRLILEKFTLCVHIY